MSEQHQQEIARVREIAERAQRRLDPHNGATHFDGCWRIHDACALQRFADEFSRLRADLAQEEKYAGDLIKERDEKQRLLDRYLVRYGKLEPIPKPPGLDALLASPLDIEGV